MPVNYGIVLDWLSGTSLGYWKSLDEDLKNVIRKIDRYTEDTWEPMENVLIEEFSIVLADQCTVSPVGPDGERVLHLDHFRMFFIFIICYMEQPANLMEIPEYRLYNIWTLSFIFIFWFQKVIFRPLWIVFNSILNIWIHC